MILHFIDRITPRVTSRNRLFSAALLWSCIGLFLAIKGAWTSHPHTWCATLLSLTVGLAFGFIKSRIVFDRVAKKIIARIGSKPQRACLGSLFSLRNWALILVMGIFGKTIGALPINAAIKSLVYVMVGTGLAYSSRLLWRAWRNSPTG